MGLNCYCPWHCRVITKNALGAEWQMHPIQLEAKKAIHSTAPLKDSFYVCDILAALDLSVEMQRNIKVGETI